LDDAVGPDADSLADVLRKRVEGAVPSLESRGHVLIDDTWNLRNPRALSYHVAANLPATNEIRQELLEMADVASRLRREADLLMTVDRVRDKAGAASPRGKIFRAACHRSRWGGIWKASVV